MVLDTSAIIAILLSESSADRLLASIEADHTRLAIAGRMSMDRLSAVLADCDHSGRGRTTSDGGGHRGATQGECVSAGRAALETIDSNP